MTITPRAIGRPMDRIDGPDKVQGLARYAFEHPVEAPLYLYPVQSTIATGRISAIDTVAACAEPGVHAVLTHDNAPRLAKVENGEHGVLQSDRVAFRGQFIGAVVAESPESARYAAGLVRFTYAADEPDFDLRADRGDLSVPSPTLSQFPMDADQGDVDSALGSAAVTLDQTYTTPMFHHNPMEPHATIAHWTDAGLTLYVSTQGVYRVKQTVLGLFALDADQVRVVSRHVGGAFGSKVLPRADVVLAVMAARTLPGRPVKFTLTRQQMFAQVGYRSPTIQRVRLGADATGRLVAIGHSSVEQTSKLSEFAEHATRMTQTVYAAPHRRSTQRLAALDVPTPSIMRAPGEAPGMWALETAVDEMAIACGLDPIEFRIRNEPSVHPTTGLPFSSRNLVECLRDGARRFGWEGRDPTPGVRREAGWLVGTGVAASTYPVLEFPGSTARIRLGSDGRYAVEIAAADIGTGTWTALTQIAADALDVDVDRIDLAIGDTATPTAISAGGSAGLASWGSTVVAAADRFRRTLAEQHGGQVPPDGLQVEESMPVNPHIGKFAMDTFGAQFAEVRVHEETGEVRVPRLLGVFAVGRVINAKTGRSQLIGGMTMGLSMALHEHSVLDRRFGHVVNQDLAQYHIASNADVGSVEAYWVEEHDPYVNPMGSKGMGEVGIVGTAAAVGNAVHHATGVRIRHLPITLDKLLAR
ncbi:xanthine dehydrogenase YagR molybdenum-binding subunit [Micromonospora pisi]|uniref:Xanthine dehydrogenase YagR molybdenum-binding subunit n=1 Tax=Micromonospora pisi TaxID=589240 RepID=A0A495JF94_9ACTN|nr:xanthine dehydrogenase family protein molybdopterin-binding subunit [Micromonospora pisi]RKR87208.1 xanthine dehydrogenase YagR molybdenum-binding subunit [Micromonospora pisi]